MANFNRVLSYLATLSNEQKGRAFELYCKWYLENDPYYKPILKRVWLWDQWPNRWGPDKGIDIIAETKRGEIWAIQAKAYDPAYSITKQDVDTFLSESSRSVISFRLLIATTAEVGSNAMEVINGQEKKVSLVLLGHLQKTNLDWPESIETLYPVISKKPKVPRPHQQQAITQILDGFKSSPIGQVHMACGTGKTLVGLWVAQELKCKNVLVLVPSISLVAQLYRQWVTNSIDFDFDPIFVCSDPTVASDKDQVITHTSELGLPVTTNAQELCIQMKQANEANVVFATYHSSTVIADACSLDSSISFDLTIADEAHRCAGPKSSAFTTIVDKQIRTDRKLFMTATPKYFTEKVKKITAEADFQIVSMNDPEKFGPIFYNMPFSAAIKQDLLSDYQVIIAVMDNETYREYAERGRFVNIDNHETDARIFATQILVAKTIKKHNLKKVITFHSRISNAQEFINSFDQAVNLLPDPERPTIEFCKTIFGNMPQSERHKTLQRFNDETAQHTGLIGNVQCLSEGVDVPAIDGIAFVDPKNSAIDIIQSVGRAIRKSDDKTIGTIIIPVFIDGKADDDELLNRSCFKHVWQVIKALRSQDDTLAEELDNVRFELGSRKYRKSASLSKIVIDVPEQIDFRFCDTINTRIVERCGIVSLAKSHPEIAAQWHPRKNGSLTPHDMTAGSHKKVWWICAKGHEWQVRVYSRTGSNKSGCPYCSNKKVNLDNCLATTHPHLINEWHVVKNDNLTPYHITAGSHKRVWWTCAKGHEWQVAIRYRTLQKLNCPYCGNKKTNKENCLATTYPKLAMQWHSTKNDGFTSYDVTAGSNKKIWWRCSNKHEWQAAICDRVRRNSSCPSCSKKS